MKSERWSSMQQDEIADILELANESIAEAVSRSLPEYLVFAEKIIVRELELTCKVLCFQCAEGLKVERKNAVEWVHKITGVSGYELIESCRANAVRVRRG